MPPIKPHAKNIAQRSRLRRKRQSAKAVEAKKRKRVESLMNLSNSPAIQTPVSCDTPAVIVPVSCDNPTGTAPVSCNSPATSTDTQECKTISEFFF